MDTLNLFEDSDDETCIAYDDYRFTPFTDPTAANRLWDEHFKRETQTRNPHVTQAFENKCSIFQFMYPELSRAEVVQKVLEEIRLNNKRLPESKEFKCAENNLIVQKFSKIFNVDINNIQQQPILSDNKDVKKSASSTLPNKIKSLIKKRNKNLEKECEDKPMTCRKI